MFLEIMTGVELGKRFEGTLDDLPLIHKHKSLSEKWSYGLCTEPGCMTWIPVGYDGESGTFNHVSNALLEHWLDPNVEHHVKVKADLIVKAETRMRWFREGRFLATQPNCPAGKTPAVQQRLTFQKVGALSTSELREFVLAVVQNMVLKKCVALNFVDSHEMQLLKPLLKDGSGSGIWKSTKFTSSLLDLKEPVKLIIKASLVGESASFTVDGYSKSLQGAPRQYYLALTAHWMDKGGQAFEAVLDVTDVAGHDAESLRAFVEASMKFYDIYDSSCGITYDNVNSNLSVFEGPNDIARALAGTRCLAHVLQLGVKAVFGLIEWAPTMLTVKSIATWMSSAENRKRMQALFDAGLGPSSPEGKLYTVPIVPPVPNLTRWSGHYGALCFATMKPVLAWLRFFGRLEVDDSLSEAKNLISAMGSPTLLEHEAYGLQSLAAMILIRDLLHPLAALTERLQSASRPTFAEAWATIASLISRWGYWAVFMPDQDPQVDDEAGLNESDLTRAGLQSLSDSVCDDGDEYNDSWRGATTFKEREEAWDALLTYHLSQLPSKRERNAPDYAAMNSGGPSPVTSSGSPFKRPAPQSNAPAKRNFRRFSLREHEAKRSRAASTAGVETSVTVEELSDVDPLTDGAVIEDVDEAASASELPENSVDGLNDNGADVVPDLGEGATLAWLHSQLPPDEGAGGLDQALEELGESAFSSLRAAKGIIMYYLNRHWKKALMLDSTTHLLSVYLFPATSSISWSGMGIDDDAFRTEVDVGRFALPGTVPRNVTEYFEQQKTRAQRRVNELVLPVVKNKTSKATVPGASGLKAVLKKTTTTTAASTYYERKLLAMDALGPDLDVEEMISAFCRVPVLWSLIRKHLMVQATAASVERVWSRAGSWATKRRRSLKVSNLADLTWLTFNQRWVDKYREQQFPGHWNQA